MVDEFPCAFYAKRLRNLAIFLYTLVSAIVALRQLLHWKRRFLSLIRLGILLILRGAFGYLLEVVFDLFSMTELTQLR